MVATLHLETVVTLDFDLPLFHSNLIRIKWIFKHNLVNGWTTELYKWNSWNIWSNSEKYKQPSLCVSFFFWYRTGKRNAQVYKSIQMQPMTQLRYAFANQGYLLQTRGITINSAVIMPYGECRIENHRPCFYKLACLIQLLACHALSFAMGLMGNGGIAMARTRS